jgi:hypothetical protein
MTSYGRDIRGSLSLDITNFKTSLMQAKAMLLEFKTMTSVVNSPITPVGGTTGTSGKTNLGNSQKAMESITKQTNTATTATAQYEARLASLVKQREGLIKQQNEVIKQQEKLNKSMNDGSKTPQNIKQALTGVQGQAMMIGGMISQIASQYLIRLIDYTAQLISASIKARSEMESFLKLMNMAPAQVNSFNQAIDRTIKAFRKPLLNNRRQY